MNNRIKIKVTDLIGSPFCISTEDGQNVFEKILPLLKKGKSITISFANVSVLVPLFLNVAIGQLYEHFNEKEICSLVQIEDLSKDDIVILKCVTDNAKKYILNPEGYNVAWQQGEDKYITS